MNRKYIYVILIVLITVILYYADEYVEEQNENYPKTEIITDGFKEEFNSTFLPQSTTGIIVKHNYYTLSYSEKHEQAEWVAYELNKNHISKNDFKRPYFVEDREVKTQSANWRNYKKSGYDKGHLCPAGDRTFDYNAFHETFLTSNISPQIQEFNRGIWNRLEQKTRFWAKKHDGVYVITGGVLQGKMKNIGEEYVSVPNYFYKIIMDTSNGEYKAIAFLIPNQASSESYYKYLVTIDEIEKETKIDFFPILEDSIENKLESEINLQVWEKR